jgi:hypothetical protein
MTPALERPFAATFPTFFRLKDPHSFAQPRLVREAIPNVLQFVRHGKLK